MFQEILRLIAETTTAATTSAGMRRSMVMRSRATDGRSASRCQGKNGQIRPSTKGLGYPRCW
jgi:hypothetical protein